MTNAIPIAYIVCFSMGLIPSIKLIYRDVKLHTIVERNGTFRAATWKERFVAVVFDVAQTLLLVNDITAVTMAIVSTNHFKWIDLSITCTLQLLAGMNLVRHLRGLFTDRVITSLPYMAVITLATGDVVCYLFNPFTRDFSGFLTWSAKTKILLLYELGFLSFLSIGPILVIGFSYRFLRQHRNLGRNDQKYLGLLIIFIFTNMIVALCQLCASAIILRSVLWSRPETKSRNVIFLVCMFAQVLCTYSVSFPGIVEWITKGIYTCMAIPHLLQRDVDHSQGAFELESQDSLRTGPV